MKKKSKTKDELYNHQKTKKKKSLADYVTNPDEGGGETTEILDKFDPKDFEEKLDYDVTDHDKNEDKAYSAKSLADYITIAHSFDKGGMENAHRVHIENHRDHLKENKENMVKAKKSGNMKYATYFKNAMTHDKSVIAHHTSQLKRLQSIG